MKYAVAALALIAAVAALIFRPPAGERASSTVVADPATSPRATGFAGFRERTRVNPAPRVIVYVAGEVVRPGVYAFRGGDRIAAALSRAGGPKPDADLVAVNLAAPLEDGEEIAVPKIGAEPASIARRPRGTRGRSRRTPQRHGRQRVTSSDVPAPLSIDINSADAGELEQLPGVGPALAARIVEYRETNGPFQSIDELADVSGITPHLQDEIGAFLVVR